jgi:chromosome condensin MukBEF complex kleisin-like MukF subunit
MAQRINGYAKDPTTIEGYTAINLHPWSMTYADAAKLVSLLDENVVVVTADDFIRLITENVPHKNAIMLK